MCVIDSSSTFRLIVLNASGAKDILSQCNILSVYSPTVQWDAGELDPAALSQLPTSLQIELMGKYRERQTMLNRSRFQQTSSDAQAFSGLQMATYLKQTELRRKVDKLKDNEASEGAQRMPSQPDSLFVLKDHAKGAAPTYHECCQESFVCILPFISDVLFAYRCTETCKGLIPWIPFDWPRRKFVLRI